MLKRPAAHPEVLFKKALLVEDEANLARALRIALKKLGIQSLHASTLAEANLVLEQQAQEVELVLLDRALPDGDGIDLCRVLRSHGFRGAILMLTARAETPDRVEGLVAGADDYLSKPFSWEELGARLIALSRRLAGGSASEASQKAIALVPDRLWDCDMDRLRVRGPSGWVELTPLEFKLASHLISAQGAIVSRDDLLKEVWGFTLLPKTRTVDHFLGRLRKHFEENPEEPKHFLTVRGAGYRFEK
jgi:two-component system alkaline phosphatase synthesis response regulator PhoP